MNKNQTTLFNSELSNFWNKYIQKQKYFINDTTATEHGKVLASLLEQILFFNKVSFKVEHATAPLAILINNLGVEGLEELLDQEAIEFVMWKTFLTFNVTDVPGVLPLQVGTVNQVGGVNFDPDQSIESGFGQLVNKPDRAVRRMLQKKLRKVYKIPNEQLASNASNLVISAYKADKLKEFGLPSTFPIDNLPKDKREMLCKYATNILEAAVLSEFKYSTFQDYESFVLSQMSFNRIQSALNLKDNVATILENENIPDLKELILQGRLRVEDILRLRKSNHAVKFRAWLASVSDSQDTINITKEYIDSLVGEKGFFETSKGKFLKTIGIYAVGFGVSSIIESSVGKVATVGVTALAEKASDFGLDLLDTYLLDGLLRGWRPRFFIDKLSKVIKEE